jgi:hypothetical protein
VSKDGTAQDVSSMESESARPSPVTPSEILPQNDLVFFRLGTIPSLDLSAFYAHYEGETRGAPC